MDSIEPKPLNNSTSPKNNYQLFSSNEPLLDLIVNESITNSKFIDIIGIHFDKIMQDYLNPFKHDKSEYEKLADYYYEREKQLELDFYYQFNQNNNEQETVSDDENDDEYQPEILSESEEEEQESLWNDF
jgi:hypothetical protein